MFAREQLQYVARKGVEIDHLFPSHVNRKEVAVFSALTVRRAQ